MNYYTSIDSPIGELTLVSDGDALVGLYMDTHPISPEQKINWKKDDGHFKETKQQLRAYFAKALTVFDLPIKFNGTDFQCKAWNALLKIPYGKTVSYRDQAIAIKAPKAVRAIGLANGKNPIAIVVPCHRVIGSNGKLTGYGGGLPRKQWLLEHEAAQASMFV